MPDLRNLALPCIVGLLLLPAAGCYSCPAHHQPTRDWAQQVDAAPLENVYRVTETFYRGPKLTKDADYQALKRLGIRTVVSLRYFHQDEEAALRNGLQYVRVPIKVWDVEDQPIEAFLRIAGDPAYQPIYAHCTLGIDRVGLVTAVHRVVVEDWSTEEALCEMTRPEWEFWLWQNLVRYVQKMDVAQLRAATGQP